MLSGLDMSIPRSAANSSRAGKDRQVLRAPGGLLGSNDVAQVSDSDLDFPHDEGDGPSIEVGEAVGPVGEERQVEVTELAGKVQHPHSDQQLGGGVERDAVGARLASGSGPGEPKSLGHPVEVHGIGSRGEVDVLGRRYRCLVDLASDPPMMTYSTPATLKAAMIDSPSRGRSASFALEPGATTRRGELAEVRLMAPVGLFFLLSREGRVEHFEHLIVVVDRLDPRSASPGQPPRAVAGPWRTAGQRRRTRCGRSSTADTGRLGQLPLGHLGSNPGEGDQTAGQRGATRDGTRRPHDQIIASTPSNETSVRARTPPA